MPTPLKPTAGFLSLFMTPSLLAAKAYHIDVVDAPIKLDQNESPWDWPAEVKARILAKLAERSWNRYPSPFGDRLVDLVAKHAGVPGDCVLLGPGSNYLLAVILNAVARNAQGTVVLARPSFALYEAHCQYEGIPYQLWPLDAQLEYDPTLLPPLPEGSVVVFASPNNPVGNVLSRAVFETLLKNNPHTLFVADEAYVEFANEPYTSLLGRYGNLILVRTFSKTMGAAGVRLGYLVASAPIIHELQKLRVPYLLNQFTLAAVGEILGDPAMLEIFAHGVRDAVAERERVRGALEKLADAKGFYVKPSQANFLLLRWPTAEESTKTYRHLIQGGVLVRNVSGAPGLTGCLRISIGKKEENDRLLEVMSG